MKQNNVTHTICAVVTQGQQRGRALGFPTANVETAAVIDPGSYVGWVTFGSHTYPAAVYHPPESRIVEAHLLDFSGDLYGHTITIHIGQKLRDPESFIDEERLIAQIAADVAAVRALCDAAAS